MYRQSQHNMLCQFIYVFIFWYFCVDTKIFEIYKSIASTHEEPLGQRLLHIPNKAFRLSSDEEKRKKKERIIARQGGKTSVLK